MSRLQMFFRISLLFGILGLVGCSTTTTDPLSSPPAQMGENICLEVSAAQHADPVAAGRSAAKSLRAKMGEDPPHAVLVAECFDGKAEKQKVLKGIASVFPKETIFGFATYGSFTQDGCLDRDSVALLGIGGKGIAVSALLQENLGIAGLTMEKDAELLQARLTDAGSSLAQSLPRCSQDRLLILMADAHSPKNQFLVEGVQQVMGRDYPITGGSANKNAGQTYVYFRGQVFEDSAVAMLLSGDFTQAMAGRVAKDNDRVISTADTGTREALDELEGKPFAMLAFNCAGRMGKLDRIEDELDAMQSSLGKDIPLFGCYCAGEIGPADQSETKPDVLSSGVGWHVMLTALGRDL